MLASWQKQFLERLVAAAHVAGDDRLATATLHRRKKTVSFQHAQVRSIDLSFSGSRTSGSQAQVLLIECQPKRGTEVDGPALKRELQDGECGGDVQVDHDAIWFQCQWGHGADAVFPVQDGRRVKELSAWATRSVTVLFDHLERRQHVVTLGKSQAESSPLDLRVTLTIGLPPSFQGTSRSCFALIASASRWMKVRSTWLSIGVSKVTTK